MINEEKIKWRIQLELEYVLICKGCHRKVMDPDKNNSNQVFTKSKCPHCAFIKEQSNKKMKQFLRVVC